MSTFVIVGAGLAGAKAAEALREEGFDGRVVLIGAEPERPYERPPLSKDYLRGESEREQAYVHPEAFYAEREIELRLATTVEAIDPAAHEVVARRRAARATTACCWPPAPSPAGSTSPGADLDGVHHLRTLADADALRARLDAGGRRGRRRRRLDRVRGRRLGSRGWAST